MKIQNQQNTNKALKGFTLIEMIGVLAIIAILASLLIPKVFQAINDSRVNNAVSSYNSLKAAAAEHYGKWGKFATASGVGLTNTLEDWDKVVLLAEQRIDKPFAVRIGDGKIGFAATGTRVRATSIAANLTGALIAQTNATYSLDGSGTNNVTGTYAIEAIIPAVLETDAKDLNDRIDGPNLGTTNKIDTLGKVKYDCSSGEGTVYIYVAHR